MDVRTSDVRDAAGNELVNQKVKGNLPGLRGMNESEDERNDDDTNSGDGRGAKNIVM